MRCRASLPSLPPPLLLPPLLLLLRLRKPR
jgi:hypothetical protein